MRTCDYVWIFAEPLLSKIVCFLPVKIITVSLVLAVYSQGTTYTKFHTGCYISSVPDKYYLVSKTFCVFRLFVKPSWRTGVKM